MALGAAVAGGLLLLAVVLPGGKNDSAVPAGLERAPQSDSRAASGDATELPESSQEASGARTPAEVAIEPDLAPAVEPETAPVTPAAPWRVLFCDGAPATNLELKLPPRKDGRPARVVTDEFGGVADWPETLDSAWVQLTGTVLGTGSGNRAHATAERGLVRLGVQRLRIEPAIPSGTASRRVKLTCSMPVRNSDDLHRRITGSDPATGLATLYAPCDRSFTIEASIVRPGPEDPDFFGTLQVPAGAPSDVPLSVPLVATYRGTIRVEDPSLTLSDVRYTLSSTEPYGRHRSKDLLVGETYEVPPGGYVLRLDVDALAALDSDQILAETRLACSVTSGLETTVPLRFEPGARIRVRAEPGGYVWRDSSDVVDLPRGRAFRVELLREGKSRIPTRWFDVERPDTKRCEVGYGPYYSSAIRPGTVHVVFRIGQRAVGEPVVVDLGPGEALEVVMPAQ